jgi:hypothetical protein
MGLHGLLQGHLYLYVRAQESSISSSSRFIHYVLPHALRGLLKLLCKLWRSNREAKTLTLHSSPNLVKVNYIKQEDMDGACTSSTHGMKNQKVF